MITLASIWNFPLYPEQASTSALLIDLIFFALVILSGFITLVLVVLISFYAIKYRSGSKADRDDRVKHTYKYEIAFIVIPVIIMMGFFLWAGTVFYTINKPPADARIVYVVGKQWMWKIQHPEGPQEINELHVPRGQPVRLVMTSQDVFHSFYIPAFRVKQDVLPNRYTSLWFEATKTGEYHLFCAEYCGAEHSLMRGTIYVMEPEVFEEWLAAESMTHGPVQGTPGSEDAPLALRGQGPFFEKGCNSCHTPRASVRAPRLDGIFGEEVRLDNGRNVIADEQYLRESIIEPNAKIVAGYESPSLMPTYKGQLTEEELRDLVEFIRSIREGWPQEVLDQ